MKRYMITASDGSLGEAVDGPIEALAIGDLAAQLRARVDLGLLAQVGLGRGRVELILTRRKRGSWACTVHRGGRPLGTLTVEHVSTVEPIPDYVGRQPRSRVRLERAS